MTKIFCIAGKKQSGKTSCRNFLYAKIMGDLGVECWLNKDGQIIVPQENDQVGILDVDSYWAVSDLAIHIHERFVAYNLADFLKSICVSLYGLDINQLYGTDADKNAYTKYIVSQIHTKIPKGTSPTDSVTNREFMEVMAKRLKYVNQDCFRNVVNRQINEDRPNVAGIFDIREPDDLIYFQRRGAKSILLLRDPYNSQSMGDAPVDTIPREQFDFVLDNREMDMPETHDAVYAKLQEWEYFE